MHIIPAQFMASFALSLSILLAIAVLILIEGLFVVRMAEVREEMPHR